ncbi:hypothetical protein PSM36_0550 [Proteiniphilum saccharofermentans]|uniref:Uncharacterized protein n=1 Tax=Proteiniphilum saccharofermentans TaxID=1642647 RepID=A0A1R3SWP1_9BACT|nr:hypothetical protein PSM36_0550 [Proteiniphilum saccharofermentans]
MKEHKHIKQILLMLPPCHYTNEGHVTESNLIYLMMTGSKRLFAFLRHSARKITGLSTII